MTSPHNSNKTGKTDKKCKKTKRCAFSLCLRRHIEKWKNRTVICYLSGIETHKWQTTHKWIKTIDM